MIIHTDIQSRQNPFTTYRDPETGRWIIVHSNQSLGMTNNQLRQNPFHAYRDPETGKWVVVQPNQNLSA